MPPNEFDHWIDEVLRDEAGLRAADRVFRNRGDARSRAAELAEDCEQKALTQALKHREKRDYFRSYEHFRNWVRRAARCRSLDRVRQDASRHTHELPEGYDRGTEDAPPLAEILESLPEDERRLVLLIHVEGRSLEEVADEVLPPDGSSRNARRLKIWRRVREALGKLRQWLFDNGISPDNWL